MPTSTQISLFCIMATVLILTPGPNFIYVLTRGSTEGRRPALMSAVGLGCGVMLHTTLAGIGVSALLRSSYLAFRMVKYGGSLYLIYLGVKTLTGHNHTLNSRNSDFDEEPDDNLAEYRCEYDQSQNYPVLPEFLTAIRKPPCIERSTSTASSGWHLYAADGYHLRYDWIFCRRYRLLAAHTCCECVMPALDKW